MEDPNEKSKNEEILDFFFTIFVCAHVFFKKSFSRLCQWLCVTSYLSSVDNRKR